MRPSSLLSPIARDSCRYAGLALWLSSFASLSEAFTFASVPSPNLDLSQLGRVGLVGDYEGISLYQFQGESESSSSASQKQSLLGRLPDGGFASLAASDASIMSLCNFVMSDGTSPGVIVGGNFTSLGGIESHGVALFNPNSSSVTALPGISGKVRAVLCNEPSNTVFVGGAFSAGNSTNAMAWVGMTGWTNLPFAGFNGPINAITTAPNGNIIFGGSFTGLGNDTITTTVQHDQQIINLSSANISSGSSSTKTGFSDPSNIVCKTNGTDAPGDTWLLEDNTAGFWKADFGFSFYPAKLRLWNTHQDGRGTQTWRFTTLPNSILNFTYTDPSSGTTASCTSECPLSSNASVAYQDFFFVNPIGMDTFRIDISAWYGSGGGLDGIELFENDIYSYAVPSFNEPACAAISTASNATSTGPWTVAPSAQSSSQYLTTTLSGGSSNSAQVVFFPDVKQSGNYTVNMNTPGCIQDNTCSSRGIVNITGTVSNGITFQTILFQSNNFDKYDQIYSGYIDAASSTFRPSVTLSPAAGQNFNLTLVAQSISLILDTPAISGGLNSLFEWNPTQAVVNTSDFTTSVFDKAGMALGTGADVQTMVSSSTQTFIGGNFTTATYSNICSVNSTGSSSLADGGLNGEVLALSLIGTTLYVGGKFTSTSSTATAGLNNIAVYDTTKNAWSALGAGVNGRVCEVVPLSMNISGTTPETVITITGDFTQLEAFGSYPAVSVSGFGVWVTSQSTWLQNVNGSAISVNGQLSTTLNDTNGDQLFAGSLSFSQFSTNGVVQLGSSLSTFPVKIQPAASSQSSGLSKRDTSSQGITGVVAGLFYENGGRNITILGGHFTATATNGSSVNNLIFINGSNSDTVTGVGPELSTDSTVLAMAVANDTLFAGGSFNGTVRGNPIGALITYNLESATFGTQPPALDAAVFAISVSPDTSGDVYVAGNFKSAGALSCPGVCVFDAAATQWSRPGTGLSGTANTLAWTSANTLIVGGSLLVNGANVSLATYNVGTSTWTAFNGASAIPGPVTALTPANSDASQLWVAGTATNGSAFLMMYDGTAWNSAGSSLGSSTTIRGLQVLTLTQNHDSTNMVPAGQTLMATGSINVPGFGNSSAVLFNGTTFQPYVLTSSSDGGASSVSQLFSQQQNFFTTPGNHLALGLVVLIGLGIALALIFLIVIAGVIAERIRRKREGYVPAPTNMYDKTSQMSRLPPDQIFGTVHKGRTGGAPMI